VPFLGLPQPNCGLAVVLYAVLAYRLQLWTYLPCSFSLLYHIGLQ
jgi:hypothetical protein